MERTYRYVGCFFEQEQVEAALAHVARSRLARTIRAPHVTFAYRPERVDTSLFGTELTVRVVGYGSNGENEGLLVELSSDCAALQEMIARIEVPHITLSVSETGRPVNTRGLAFAPIAPFPLTGRFGGYARGRAFTRPPRGKKE